MASQKSKSKNSAAVTTELIDSYENNQRSDSFRFKRLDINTLTVVLITKLTIFFFAAQSYQITKDQPIAERNWFLNLFNHWDAGNYLKIAEFGYTNSGDDRYTIVFFPLYPALIKLSSVVFGNYILSGLLVSAIASIALGLIFKQLVKLDYSEQTAKLAIFFLFIFPTSFYLHLVYTESLFLSLTVGCFLAARSRNWLLVGILGMLAGLTRINGLIILPALIFEVWEEYKDTRRINSKWLFLLFIPVGFLSYLALNYFVTGDPLMFLTYQRENFQRYLQMPWDAVYATYGRISNPKPTDSQMQGVQELTFVIIGLVASILGWKYLRKSYAAWMSLNWLLFISTSFILSVPRYTLTMFPLFI